MGSELAKARLIGMSSPKNYSKPPTVIQYAGLYGLIQGLIGIAFGIFLVVREAQGFHDPTAKISGYGTALWFFFIFGAVAVCGYFLYRGRSWGRGPVVMLQICLVPVAYYMFRSGRPELAVPPRWSDSWARAAVQLHRRQLVDDGPLPRLRTEHHELVTALLHHEATTDPQVYGRASG